MNKDKLIETQKEYIKFLGDELGKHEAMIVVRPYMAPSKELIEKGTMIRNKIASFENEIETIQCMSCEKTITKQEALVYCGECGR